MTAFNNVGSALRLARELRRMTQAALARKACVGKSQLSKYEGGKELPKLESLGKVLSALRLSPFAFFYLVDLVDKGAVSLESGAPPEPLLSAFPEGMLSNESQAAVDAVLQGMYALLRANLIDQVRLRSRD